MTTGVKIDPGATGTTARCCLCRGTDRLEVTEDLPGSGWRCADHDRCRQRVADIVSAHQAWGEIVG